MLEPIRHAILRWVRLPRDPEPPYGSPGSIRIFRAGTNFYWLCLARWAGGQLLALFALIASVVFAGQLLRDLRGWQKGEPTRTSWVWSHAGDVQVGLPPAVIEKSKPYAHWLVPLIAVSEILAIAFFIAQFVCTLLAQRLAYELRWYIVTDRSLRIRVGIWKLQETTMSFANLQQVEVTQGPIQRLFKLADVRVQSAGGGIQKEPDGHAKSLHIGVFEGVTNASEIRDLILARLRQYRDSGLESTERRALPQTAAPSSRALSGTAPEATAAARELLAEVKALRQSLAPSASILTNKKGAA